MSPTFTVLVRHRRASPRCGSKVQTAECVRVVRVLIRGASLSGGRRDSPARQQAHGFPAREHGMRRAARQPPPTRQGGGGASPMPGPGDDFCVGSGGRRPHNPGVATDPRQREMRSESHPAHRAGRAAVLRRPGRRRRPEAARPAPGQPPLLPLPRQAGCAAHLRRALWRRPQPRLRLPALPRRIKGPRLQPDAHLLRHLPRNPRFLRHRREHARPETRPLRLPVGALVHPRRGRRRQQV